MWPGGAGVSAGTLQLIARFGKLPDVLVVLMCDLFCRDLRASYLMGSRSQTSTRILDRVLEWVGPWLSCKREIVVVWLYFFEVLFCF